MENLLTPDCIRTFTGVYVNVFEPTIDMIDIEDIAHALSNQPRFGGHLPEFYSVSQHSVACSWAADSEDKLVALLHDASEAYLIDIPSPIKAGLCNYKEIEHNLMLLIAEKFDFEYPLNPEIKKIDRHMLQAEWDNLMLGMEVPVDLTCKSPKEAKKEFLETYENLIK